MKDSFRFAGLLYDLLASIYSLGAIDRCKVANHDIIETGDSVLFTGVGHGKDAIHAAKMGARVTVLDSSETMLNVLRKNIETMSFEYPIRIIHCDIMDFNEAKQYDIVFSNFFLNYFSNAEAVGVIGQLARLVREEGRIVVGEFCPPKGGAISSIRQKIYWYVAVVFHHFATNNAVHSICDYEAILNDVGFKTEDIKYVKVTFADCFYSISTKRYGQKTRTAKVIIQPPGGRG